MDCYLGLTFADGSIPWGQEGSRGGHLLDLVGGRFGGGGGARGRSHSRDCGG